MPNGALHLTSGLRTCPLAARLYHIRLQVSSGVRQQHTMRKRPAVVQIRLPDGPELSQMHRRSAYASDESTEVRAHAIVLTLKLMF